MNCVRALPVVAIDGPAGAGKSTVARAVAERLGFAYVDTGAMYRAVALKCLRQGVPLEDADRATRVAQGARIEFAPGRDGAQRVLLDGEDVTRAIREHEVSDAASVVSAHASVRRLMVERQRELGRAGGVVMEGRDIQTNVFPDAEVKIYLSASTEERARRRAQDLQDSGLAVPPMAELLRSIEERDRRDSTRATAPLAPAPDAIVIDTDGMTVDEVVDAIVRLVGERGKGGARDSG